MNYRIRHCASLAASALVLVSCSRDRDDYAQPAVEAWQMHYEVRIGSIDEPNYSLSAVSSIAIGEKGWFFVAQPQEGVIRVYDELGNYKMSIGGRGLGPGEFSDLGAVGILSDTVYAVNRRPGYINYFSDTGVHLGSLDAAALFGNEYALPMPSKLLPRGVAVVLPGRTSEIHEMPLRSPVLAVQRGGATLDTLLFIESERLRISTSNGDLEMVSPFQNQPAFSFARDGTRMAVVERPWPTSQEPSSYRITQIVLGGDTIYSQEYNYQPVTFPPEKYEDAVQRLVRVVQNVIPDVSLAEAMVRRALPAPRFERPVERALFADNGDLWLQRESTSNSHDLWEIHSPAGERRATVALPTGLTIVKIGEGLLWGIETDELGLQYVIRARLSRNDGQFRAPY
jgi:hypothetical protein